MTPNLVERPAGSDPAAGPAARVSWHGGAAFSLSLGGLEVLVDPSFSRPGDYPWFDERSANPHAPTATAYLAAHRPDYLFVTHGHFDHFDLKTVEALAKAVPFRVVGSREVLEVCRDKLGLPTERLWPCPVHGDGWLELERDSPVSSSGVARVRVASLPAPHWFTGDEGAAVAAKLAGRPERYGAMPCGGPMLGFLFETAPGGPAEAGQGVAPSRVDKVDKEEGTAVRVFVSGDTEPGGFPSAGEVGTIDAAVVCCGGRLINPATKQLEGPFLDEVALARIAAEVLRPRVLVPIHYDHPVFQTPFDPRRLEAELARYAGPPRVFVPPYNTWVSLV